LRFEAAKAAAPYVHARLQTTTLAGDPEKPLKAYSMSELEAARRLAFLMTKAAGNCLLDELLARLTELPKESRDEAINFAVQSTATIAWVPNPGPQTQAFLCEADELFYGGEAGGGKTDLGIGLSLTTHKRSLLLRRINKDAVKIKPRLEEILGHDHGYKDQLQRWRLPAMSICPQLCRAGVLHER
jgi:hypothetical protein